MGTDAFGLLPGRRSLWLYVPLLIAFAPTSILLWEPVDWRPAEVAALVVCAVLGLDALARHMDDSWGVRYTIGSTAVIAVAMVVLGPVPAGVVGAGSVLIDSLLLRARSAHVAANVTLYAWLPLLGGLVADRWVEPLDGATFAVAVLLLALLLDGAITIGTGIHQHLMGLQRFGEQVRLYVRQLPWSGILGVAVVSGTYGYHVGGTGVLALMLLGVVVSEALLLKLDRAERELRAERDLHEKYLRMVGTAVVSIDPDVRVALINRRAVELLGLSGRDDLLGSDWVEVSGGRTAPDAERRRYLRLLDGDGDGAAFETTVHLRNGQTRILGWNSTLVRGDGGTVTSLLLAGEDVTDRRDSERRMAYLAYNDALTGLPNRTSFDQDLPDLLAEAEVCGCAAALLFMDLDGFKRVNDRHGHQAGDRLLAEAAARLRAVAGVDDMLVRRGGDEFLMLVPDLSAGAEDGAGARRATAAVAERIVRAFDAPFPVAGTTVTIGITVGCAIYPLDGTDPECLQRVADQAMYGVKPGSRGGRAPGR